MFHTVSKAYTTYPSCPCTNCGTLAGEAMTLFQCGTKRIDESLEKVAFRLGLFCKPGCYEEYYRDVTTPDEDIQVTQHEVTEKWVAITPENFVFEFDTEDEACRFQRGWRVAKGLDPITGK